jgi:hypothetical protein
MCLQVTEEEVMASFISASIHQTAAASTLELNIAAFQSKGEGTRQAGGGHANAGPCEDGQGKRGQLRSIAKAHFNQHHPRVLGAVSTKLVS